MTNSKKLEHKIDESFVINEGSCWFKRLYKECKQISPHIRFKRIRMGFYRIYFKQAYVHEVYKEMPLKGYDFIDDDPRFESQKYAEEYEQDGELQRKVKNYVEGYYDSMKAIKVRVNSFMNDPEAYKTMRQAYKQIKIY